jgi:hypothetical protein
MVLDEVPPLGAAEEELPEMPGLADLDRPDLSQMTDFSKLDSHTM